MNLQDSFVITASAPPSTTPTTAAANPSVAPPSRPTYSGRKAKRGEALLDDPTFVDFKKRKIELEMTILESGIEKSGLEKRLLAQQIEESAARTSYFKAATQAINLKIREPLDCSFNED